MNYMIYYLNKIGNLSHRIHNYFRLLKIKIKLHSIIDQLRIKKLYFDLKYKILKIDYISH